MKCERTSEEVAGTGGVREAMSWLHRLQCAECRRAHAADRLVLRAAAQMRGEAPPADSLARTLAATGCSAVPASAEELRAALARALALVGVGIFATTLAEPEQIGRTLFGAPQFPAATAQGVAGFWALVGLFWYLKPMVALALEAVPGLASRRRLCLAGSAGGAAILWLLPWLQFHSPAALSPALGIGLNALLALASTILGGYLVEQAQRIGATGRLGALHQAALHLAALTAPVLGLVGGRVVAPPVAAALLGLFGLAAACLMPNGAGLAHRRAGPADQVRSLGQARELWQVAALLLLVIGPSSFTALLDKQQSLHGFSTGDRLHLTWIAEAATLASILAYTALCRRVNLRSLLPVGILANAGGTLLYLAYAGPLSFAAAAAIEIVNGLAAALIIVTLFDLAVRAVPRQCP